MTRPRRLVARSLGAALAVVALAGCGNAVRAGAAAVVGDTRISTDTLAKDVSAGLADPGVSSTLTGDPAAFQRNILQLMIRSRLFDAAAKSQGVNVTPGQVDEQYAALEQQNGGAQGLLTEAAKEGLTPAQVRDVARTSAQGTALGDKLTADVPVPDSVLQQAYQANIDSYDQVRTAQILLPTLAEAQALLPKAAALDDAGFAELARTTSTDATTKDKGGDIGLAPRSAFEQNSLSDYGKAAFAAKVGDTFAVASPKGGHVVRVLERQTTTLAQATPALRRTVLKTDISAAVQKVLQDTARSLHISVNPRFGHWSSTDLSVGAPTDQPGHVLSSPAAGAGSLAPADGSATPAP